MSQTNAQTIVNSVIFLKKSENELVSLCGEIHYAGIASNEQLYLMRSYLQDIEGWQKRIRDEITPPDKGVTH